MSDKLKDLPPAALSAAMRTGTAGWGKWGSMDTHARYAQPIWPRSRRRCHCGCKRRATHSGMCNGVSLMDGCELHVRRWVRDGLGAIAARLRAREAASVGEANTTTKELTDG